MDQLIEESYEDPVDPSSLKPLEREPADRTIPSRAELESNRDIDRLSTQPTGVWNKRIYSLRKKDFDGVADKPKFSFIKFVPNSRFLWFHDLYNKSKGSTGTITKPDMQYLLSFYMNPDEKKKMYDYFNTKVKAEAKGFTVPPRPGGFSKAFTPALTGNQQSLKFIPSNPGIHNIEDDPRFLTMIRETLGEAAYNRLSEGVHRLVVTTMDKYGDETNEYIGEIESRTTPDWQQFSKSLEKYIHQLIASGSSKVDEFGLPIDDPTVVDFSSLNAKTQKLLLGMRRRLLSNTFTLSDLYEFARSAKEITHLEETTYLMSLFDPWRVRDAKIPNPMPMPTASFKLRTTITLTTNALGNIAFAIQPYFAAQDSAAVLSSLGVNNNASLTGSAPSNFFIGTPIGQMLPEGMYRSYRLVSAACRMSPVSSSLTSSGFITIGLALDNTHNFTSGASPIAGYAEYGSFQIIENLYYKHSVSFSANKPIEAKWLPQDNNDLEFKEVSDTVVIAEIAATMGHGKIVGYGQGLPASSPCLKVDFVMNFEALVSPTLYDYVPSTFYKGGMSEIEEAKRMFTPHVAIAQDFPDAPTHAIMVPGKSEHATINLPPREDSKSLLGNLLASLKEGLGYVADKIPWQAVATSVASSII